MWGGWTSHEIVKCAHCLPTLTQRLLNNRVKRTESRNVGLVTWNELLYQRKSTSIVIQKFS